MDDADKIITVPNQTLMRKKQFKFWLVNLYRVNELLNEEYDDFYSMIYYINLSELLNPNEGRKYVNKIISLGYVENNSLFFELEKHLNIIASTLTEEELLWINYKRDSACHIFQDSYNEIKDDFKVREIRKGVPFKPIREKLESFCKQFNMIDNDINKHIHSKLYTHIYNMFTCLHGKNG